MGLAGVLPADDTLPQRPCPPIRHSRVEVLVEVPEDSGGEDVGRRGRTRCRRVAGSVPPGEPVRRPLPLGGQGPARSASGGDPPRVGGGTWPTSS